MDKDRLAICRIINDMLGIQESHGVSPTSTACTRPEYYIEGISALESYIEMVRSEAMGWTHADDCVDLDNNKDPRLKNVPDMLCRAQKDLAETRAQEPCVQGDLDKNGQTQAKYKNNAHPNNAVDKGVNCRYFLQ